MRMVEGERTEMFVCAATVSNEMEKLMKGERGGGKRRKTSEKPKVKRTGFPWRGNLSFPKRWGNS
jgi:hypothetical protein